MRKRREAFTIPLLIGREVWTPPARDPPPGGEGAGGQHGGRRKAAPEGPVLGLHGRCRREQRRSPDQDGRSQSLWFVPLAGVRHPFPSRTRPLRPPAAMIVRSRARESSAARTFFFTKKAPLRTTIRNGAFGEKENREERVESSAWPARLGAPRTAIQPCSTEAHCIVTTHYILLPSPYSLLNFAIASASFLRCIFRGVGSMLNSVIDDVISCGTSSSFS